MVLSHKRCVTGAWHLSQFAPKKKKKTNKAEQKLSFIRIIILSLPSMNTDYNFM